MTIKILLNILGYGLAAIGIVAVLLDFFQAKKITVRNEIELTEIAHQSQPMVDNKPEDSQNDQGYRNRYDLIDRQSGSDFDVGKSEKTNL